MRVCGLQVFRRTTIHHAPGTAASAQTRPDPSHEIMAKNGKAANYLQAERNEATNSLQQESDDRQQQNSKLTTNLRKMNVMIKAPPSHWMTAREQERDIALLSCICARASKKTLVCEMAAARCGPTATRAPLVGSRGEQLHLASGYVGTCGN